MELCLVCNRQFKNKMALSKHLNMGHHIDGKEYTLVYIHKNINPVCKCGCGESTKYVNKEYRFNDYIHNHHNYDGKSTLGMKVHTKDSIERAMIARKKTCLEKYGVDSVMKVKEFSEKVRRTGSNHPAWKGGISKLIARLRGSHQIYKLWVYPILCRDGFKCTKCGISSNSLCVHHNKEKMCDIFHKFFPKDLHELSFEEEGRILDMIVHYHVDNSIPGISLCEKCHKEEHKRNK